MLSAKSFLIASFVINVFIQIRCNQANNGLSNVIDVDDSSRREAELNPKYIEGATNMSSLWLYQQAGQILKPKVVHCFA